MKHCFITPTEFMNDPEIGWKSDFMLVLSHLLDRDCTNKYAEEVIKFRESWKTIYLDNGLFENLEPESGKDLLRKAELIWAEYVFAPDYLYDNTKTALAFNTFADLRDELEVDVKLAFVVQADNPLDYLNSYKWAEENDRIDMIWISILSVPKSFESITQSDDITLNRICCMRILEDFIKPKKDAHLLWLWSSLWDLVEWKKYNFIKSNDSSSAFQNWLFGRKYHKPDSEPYPEVDWGKIEEKVNFDSQREFIDDIKYKQIVENIDFITNLIKE